jgi:hypothetical protein
MKILKHLFLPLLATFCVSALPLSSAFAAEEEKRHQDARGLDNRRSEQSLPGRLTVAKFLTPSGILQPLTKLSAALTGAISGLLKTMRDQGPPFTIYGPLPDKDRLTFLHEDLKAEIGKFLSPIDFTHFCLACKKPGQPGKISRKALFLRLTTDARWLDHEAEVRRIPELTIWHDESREIGDEEIGLCTRSLPNVKRMKLGRSFEPTTVCITDGGLEHIGTLAKLQELSLKQQEEVTDEGLKHIGALANLRVLVLSCLGKVTGVGLEHLKGHLALQRLQLESVKVIDADIQHLSGLPALRELELRKIQEVTDAGLQHLSGLPVLKRLQLSGLKRVTDEGLQHLSGLLGLQHLQLESMQITDEGLQHLSGLPALRELELRDIQEVTDAGLQHLSGLPVLRQLELEWMNNITDVGLQHLSHSSLENLKLCELERITSIPLLKDLPALRELRLEFIFSPFFEPRGGDLQRLACLRQLQYIKWCIREKVGYLNYAPSAPDI